MKGAIRSIAVLNIGLLVQKFGPDMSMIHRKLGNLVVWMLGILLTSLPSTILQRARKRHQLTKRSSSAIVRDAPRKGGEL